MHISKAEIAKQASADELTLKHTQFTKPAGLPTTAGLMLATQILIFSVVFFFASFGFTFSVFRYLYLTDSRQKTWQMHFINVKTLQLTVTFHYSAQRTTRSEAPPLSRCALFALDRARLAWQYR